MAQISSTELSQLRRNAKRLARAQGITLSQALDQEASRRGYPNWSLLMKHRGTATATSAIPSSGSPVRTRAQIQALLGLPRMDASSSEKQIIMGIVQRYADIVKDVVEVTPLTLIMDIEACHSNGCPLYLAGLLEADRDSDVVHDVAGIERYLNRETGKLEEGFTPRYAYASLGSLSAAAP